MTGADAGPPILAILPTAAKKKGVLVILAIMNKIIAWIRIHIKPISRIHGFLKMAITFICIPIVAIRT